MHGWWWDGAGGWGGLIGLALMLAFWGLIVLGIVQLVRSFGGSRDEPRGPDDGRYQSPRPSAIDVLKERYARGEIEREEYLQRKADLES